MYLLGVIREKNDCKKNDISLHFDKILIIAELAEHSPIIKPEKFGCMTIQPTIQGATFSMHGQLYHGHYLIISPLHRHREVANENH